MAPTKGKDFRKNAWAWAENVPADYKISLEDVYKVYRIDIQKCIFGSCKRNCRGNPFCLTGIGETRWLNDTNETVSDIDDPAVEKRQDKNFVGLKNLGATCYVNSLLQLWFHNAAFREAIFSWNPLADTQESQNPTLFVEDDEIFFSPQSVVGHLQVLFAMMALSKKRTVEPADFVTSLKLDTSEQQDAQEFSKLFFSLLENKLRDQVNPSVNNFIQNNFCGEYAYVTRCSKCSTESTRSSQFYELDLNILGMKTLKESLADFLKEEKLDGDNAYLCGVCNEKQNAERLIKLKSLPPTLCFQLMRFVFDRQKGKKKKLTSHLQFPETVDMTEYIEDATVPYIYNLSAVLIHKGPGAYSGHYIAHILTSQGWYKFNDEHTESMDGKKLKLNDDDLDDFPKKSKTPRVPKGSIASCNAYMLVYTRQTDEKNEDIPVEDQEALLDNVRQKLHPKILRLVEYKNKEFSKWVEEITECRNTKLGKSLLLKEEVSSIVRSLPVNDEPCFDVVQYSWLNQWLSNDGSKSVAPINNEALLCSHKKMNPSCVTDVKYINPSAADKLYEQFSGGPRLKLPQDECLECIRNEFSLLKLKMKTAEEQKFITVATKNKLDENTPGFWVSRRFLKSWRRLVIERAEKQLSCKSINNLKFEQDAHKNSATVNGNNISHSSSKVSKWNSNSGSKREETYMDQNSGGDSLMSTNNCPPKLERCGSKSNGTNSSSGPSDSSSEMPLLRPNMDHRSNKRRNINECERIPSLSEINSDEVKSETKKNFESADVCFSDKCLSPLTKEKVLKVKQCYSALDSVNETAQNVKECLIASIDDDPGGVKTTLDKSVEKIVDEVGSIKNTCKVLLFDIYKRKSDECLSSLTKEKALKVKQCYNALDSVNETAQNVKECVFASIEDDPGGLKTTLDKSVEKIVDEVGLMKNTCKLLLFDICNRRRSPRKTEAVVSLPRTPTKSVVKKEFESKSCSQAAGSSTDNEGCDSDGGDVSPVLDRGESSKRISENDLFNGSVKKLRSDFSMKAEFVDNDQLEEFGELNEDILCEHGNLCFQENLRRLVPPSVWDIFKSYFPLAKTFTNEANPCLMCESLACEGEVAKVQLRQEAVKQKDLLNELHSRLNNDLSKFSSTLENGPMYLVSSDFISDWRRFIRGAGRTEQPPSIDNSGLFCDCGLLLYNPDVDSEKSLFVAVTEQEWEILSKLYSIIKGVVKVFKDPDSQLLQTDPDVCQTCLLKRLEKEHEEQLTYSNAKIFIRFVQDNSDPGSDDASSNPKKVKLNNGTSTYIPPPSVTNGCSSLTDVQEVRRSTRPRRGRGEKEITVSSNDTIKDIKVKIFQMCSVAPYDQQLSSLSGKRLEENSATLSSLGIFPSTVLLVKFTENAGGDASATEFTSAAPVEAGFKGTELMNF